MAIHGPDARFSVVDGGLPKIEVLRRAEERSREIIEGALVVAASWEKDVCECGHGRMAHCGDHECCNFDMTRAEGAGACGERGCECPVFRLTQPGMFVCDVKMR